MLSGFVISQADGRPMYRQVMEQIKQRVAVADWPPGQKIPSIRELAVALGISVITIKRAYLELEREGVIATMQGKGSFVASDADLGTSLHRRELDELIARVVRLGDLCGMPLEDILSRVKDAHANHPRRQP